MDRGVIGHATSSDLDIWVVQPPLSAPGAGFKHLEVPQVVTVEGRTALLFSCDTAALAAGRETGGIWAVEIDAVAGPYPVEKASLLVEERLYAGRAVQNRAGQWVLLAFENRTDNGGFAGSLSDPIGLEWAHDQLRLVEVS